MYYFKAFKNCNTTAVIFITLYDCSSLLFLCIHYAVNLFMTHCRFVPLNINLNPQPLAPVNYHFTFLFVCLYVCLFDEFDSQISCINILVFSVQLSHTAYMLKFIQIVANGRIRGKNSFDLCFIHHMLIIRCYISIHLRK